MAATKVILDTNVIVSAHLNEEGNEAVVLAHALAGRFFLCASEPILAEYDLVLHRPELRINPDRVNEMLRRIRAVSEMVEPNRTLSAATDPDDNRFLECAEAAGVDFLVTGNKRHFPTRWGKTEIVNARELMERIGPQR